MQASQILAGRQDRVALLLRGADRREVGRLRLEDQAEFDQPHRVVELLAGLGHPSQHLAVEQVPVLARQHARSGLLPDLDQPLADQHLDRFAQRIAADAEFRGERQLVRQDGVLAEVAADDAHAKRVDDVIVEIGAPQRRAH